jgi:hypothetical protein
MTGPHFEAGEPGVDDEPERDELPASVHEPAEHGLAQPGAAPKMNYAKNP